MKNAWMICVAAMFGLTSAAAFAAEPLARQLERAVYQEEAAGNTTEALRLYREVTEQAAAVRPAAAEAFVRLGKRLKAQGDTKQAEAALRRVIEEYPDQTRFCAQARRILAEMGAQAGAEPGAESSAPLAAKSDPLHDIKVSTLLSRAQAQMAQAAMGRGTSDEAEKTFMELLEVAPDMPDAWCGLGRVCLNQKRNEPAKKAFQRCLDLCSTNSEALNGLGDVARDEGNTTLAMQLWRKVVSLTPNAVQTMFALARAAMDSNDYDEAIKWADLALKAAPQWQEAMDLRDDAKALKRGLTRKDLGFVKSSNGEVSYSQTRIRSEDVGYFVARIDRGPSFVSAALLDKAKEGGTTVTAAIIEALAVLMKTRDAQSSGHENAFRTLVTLYNDMSTDPRFLPIFEDVMLHDNVHEQRTRAIDTLLRNGSPEAMQIIQRALKSSDLSPNEKEHILKYLREQEKAASGTTTKTQTTR